MKVIKKMVVVAVAAAGLGLSATQAIACPGVGNTVFNILSGNADPNCTMDKANAVAKRVIPGYADAERNIVNQFRPQPTYSAPFPPVPVFGPTPMFRPAPPVMFPPPPMFFPPPPPMFFPQPVYPGFYR